MAYTDPPTVATGQVMQASDWNTYIRDNMRAMNRWTSYTPVWTASSTNPTLNNGNLIGNYIKFEQVCFVEIHLTFGSTTSIGSGFYFFTLPFASYTASFANYRQNIPLVLLNDGVQWYLNLQGTVQSGSTALELQCQQNTPFTFGAADVIHVQGQYRIA